MLTIVLCKVTFTLFLFFFLTYRKQHEHVNEKREAEAEVAGSPGCGRLLTALPSLFPTMWCL